MPTRKLSYYIAESPEIIERCIQLRTDHIAQANKFWDYTEKLGGESYYIGFNNSIFAIKFPYGKHPEGFLKAKAGQPSMPMRGKSGTKWRDEFTNLGKFPSAVEAMKGIIDAPGCISYKTPNGGEGSHLIGGFSRTIQVCWYDENSPFMIALPDVKKEIRLIRAEHPEAVFEKEIEQWNPPEGLKEILLEEWDLMVAKFEKSKCESA